MLTAKFISSLTALLLTLTASAPAARAQEATQDAFFGRFPFYEENTLADGSSFKLPIHVPLVDGLLLGGPVDLERAQEAIRREGFPKLQAFPLSQTQGAAFLLSFDHQKIDYGYGETNEGKPALFLIVAVSTRPVRSVGLPAQLSGLGLKYHYGQLIDQISRRELPGAGFLVLRFATEPSRLGRLFEHYGYGSVPHASLRYARDDQGTAVTLGNAVHPDLRMFRHASWMEYFSSRVNFEFNLLTGTYTNDTVMREYMEADRTLQFFDAGRDGFEVNPGSIFGQTVDYIQFEPVVWNQFSRLRYACYFAGFVP